MSNKRFFFFLQVFLLMVLTAALSESAEIVVIGDTQLRPVNEIVAGIKDSVDESVRVYALADARGKIRNIASREDAKVVVALGKDALDEALQLPSSIAVIYDLVITPPQISRENTTGFYMATPVKEYSELLRNYFPSIKRLAVVGSRNLINLLEASGQSHVASYNVKSPFEMVNAVKQIESADAILLLPDVSFMTATALEEVYLLSFRRNIPLLGVSEKHVKRGALFALVFDPVSVGRSIGANASNALKGTDMGRVPPSPPQKFELYINSDTAKKMGIHIPNELAKKAQRIYP